MEEKIVTAEAEPESCELDFGAHHDETKKEKYTSSMDLDMTKIYVYENYPNLKKENSPVYGVDSWKDVVIRPLYFDELMYVLHAEGTHVVLFGGTWSRTTQDVIDRINAAARKYNVDTVYNFDFRADGESADTNFKADLTEQADYDGPDKKDPVGAANCNYIYGEMVQHHLKNLNDWVENKIGTDGEITYLNLYQDPVTVPNLTEPFLFVFNKKNTKDNSGVSHETESEYYPIVSALEIQGFRGADGKIYKDEACTEEDTGFDARLDALFDTIGPEGVTPYTNQDYMFDAFKQNGRGHAFKTEDCFKKGEQINIQPICLAQMLWMLKQDASYILLFAGAWCANSQGGVATINDYAVANNVRVYMMDTRLDGKHPIDFWMYPRLNELTITHPALVERDFEIWESRLPGAQILCSIRGGRVNHPVGFSRVDAEGNEHTILRIDLPYLIACDMNRMGMHNDIMPCLASCNHGGIELINCQDSFVYSEPRYRLYTAGVYAVMGAYCRNLGIEVHDKTIDRTAPIVPGQPVRSVERKAYHKDHDWWKERAGKKSESAPTGVEGTVEVETEPDSCSLF